MNKRISFYLFLITTSFAIAISILYYPKLPQTIASHYGLNGKADGWMSKEWFVVFQISLSLFFFALFTLISYFIPRFNNSLINLPNKDYWLTGNRREESLSKISTLLYLIGSSVNIFFVLIFMEVYSANMDKTYKIGSAVWFYLVFFISLTGILVIKHIQYFNNKNH